jgi:hypothetical protein
MKSKSLHAEYRRPRHWTIIVLLGSCGLVASGTYGVYLGSVDSYDIITVLMAVFGIVFGILGLISAARYRLVVCDSGIERVNIDRRFIAWNEVDEIEYSGEEIRVNGRGKKISLDRDIGDRGELLRIVLAKVDENHVRLSGSGWSGGREAPR